jgi:hypothetical protein
MSFEDILTLLIGTSEEKVSPSNLLEACTKFNMKQIEYFNVNQDPLFENGYNFIIKTENGEDARLEIIEVEENLLQSGFQIIYKPKLLFPKITKDFSCLYNLLQSYYLMEEAQNFEGIELYNFCNEISQCYLSKSKVNGQDVLNFRVTNKSIWEKYN